MMFLQLITDRLSVVIIHDGHFYLWNGLIQHILVQKDESDADGE
jgi:hypothetical protein